MFRFNFKSLICTTLMALATVFALASPATAEQFVLDEPVMILSVEEMPVLVSQPVTGSSAPQAFEIQAFVSETSELPTETDQSANEPIPVSNASYGNSFAEVPKRATLSHSVYGMAQASLGSPVTLHIDPGISS